MGQARSPLCSPRQWILPTCLVTDLRVRDPCLRLPGFGFEGTFAAALKALGRRLRFLILSLGCTALLGGTCKRGSVHAILRRHAGISKSPGTVAGTSLWILAPMLSR